MVNGQPMNAISWDSFYCIRIGKIHDNVLNSHMKPCEENNRIFLEGNRKLQSWEKNREEILPHKDLIEITWIDNLICIIRYFLT